MEMEISLTPKQIEYINNANHRWNFSVGAVRSGKSFIAVRYVIMKRILERKGKKGLNFILGASRENIERNVLAPMRELWGDRAVSEINSRNIATIAGEQVYCVGADNRRGVSRLRGSEMKYCYCDEVCDINQEVFDMLKSRLSLPYSCFDGAANPANPNHFVKQFLDKEGLDLYCQHTTIYDNPTLTPSYVESLENEYAGTIYYDRYILGKWTLAEGLIYPKHLEAFEDAQNEKYGRYAVSLDYGTQNAFAALKWGLDDEGVWHAIDEYYYSGRTEMAQKTDLEYVDDMIEFTNDIKTDEKIEIIVDPSAASFIAALRKVSRFKVRKAKNSVLDGIRNTAVCMNTGKIKLSFDCVNLKAELEGYSWDESSQIERPIKDNDHACDALRYFVATKNLVKKKEKYDSVFGDDSEWI